MTFLPIVDRELRAAARRRGTFRLRWWAALTAMAVAFSSLLFLASGSGSRSVGEPLFSLLAGLAFLLCPLLGLALTADSMSEEKREGTLGLLFLTDLKGYDVVLGKFTASSLNAFYGLFALLPMMALPLLLGGVTGGELWRMSLALVNELFFCLTAGIFVSSLARESRAAVAGTLWLLLVVTAVFPAVKRVGEALHITPAWFVFTAISPYYPVACAGDAMYRSNAAMFWGTLAASHLAGWLFLGLASFILPRVWQDKGRVGNRREHLHPLEIGGAANPRVRHQRNAEALSINPVLWLIGKDPMLRIATWFIVGVWGLVALAISRFWPGQPNAAFVFGKVCGFLFKVLVAFQACRFFSDARRNGTLEMLLCTPLRTADILRGQWLALRRLFLLPLLLFLFFGLVPLFFAVWSSMGGFKDFQVGSSLVGAGIGGGVFLGFAATFLLDVTAVCWFGMWLALTLKKPAMAPFLTILLVLVIPSFFCVLDLVADVFFIAWSASQLQQDIRYLIARRTEAAQRVAMSQTTLPPVITPR